MKPVSRAISWAVLGLTLLAGCLAALPVRAEDAPAPSFERAPEVRTLDKAEEIVARATKAGFRVVHRAMRVLSRKEAQVFYAEHEGKPFFEGLTSFMSSGLVVHITASSSVAHARTRSARSPAGPR